MMGPWIIAFTSIIIFKITESAEVSKYCRKITSIYGGEELVCKNVSSEFFQQFDLILTKTHWLTCENCSLNTIDERTFKITRNNVTFLRLVASNVHKIKPFSFSKFTFLKVINLSNNSIDELSSKSFVNLTKLNQLDLSFNSLNILTNELFVEAVNLDWINLNHNKLFYIQPEAFAGLKNLKHLHLNHNQLERLDGHIFRHLSNLLWLYLEHNNIVQIDSFAFSNLNNLNSLYLNNNNISFLVPYNFKPLNNLVDLQMRNNNLAEIQTSSFNHLTSLKTLYLGQNRIKSVKPYGFIGLNNLQILDLMDNEIDDFDLKYFKDMNNLIMLWVGNNEIVNFTIDIKDQELKALKSLGLDNNNLTILNYKLLYNKMPNIRDIFITNNTWKCEFLINMFNFMNEKDVNLCTSSSCKVNQTMIYIEKICASQHIGNNKHDDIEDATSIDSDFVSERASLHNFNLVLVVIFEFLLILS